MVLRKTGPVSYDVQVGQAVEHRHASQLRMRLFDMPDKSNEEEIQDEIVREFDNQQSSRDRLAIQHEQQEPLHAPPLLEIHPVLPFRGPPFMGHPERPAVKTPAVNRPCCHPASEREPLPTEPVPAVIPVLPERRNLRDRSTIHLKTKFSDEYSGLGMSVQ